MPAQTASRPHGVDENNPIVSCGSQRAPWWNTRRYPVPPACTVWRRNRRAPLWPGAIARFDGLARERPLVERHQQRLETRSERLDGGGGRQLAERGELGASDPGDLPGARRGPRRTRADAAPDVARDPRGPLGLTTGIDATRRFVTSSLQAARDRVLGVQLDRRVERGGGLVQLAAFHVAPRQPRQRAFVRRRRFRQLEVGRERLRTEIAGLRVLDRALLQFLDGRHHYSLSVRAHDWGTSQRISQEFRRSGAQAGIGRASTT